ncbi:hypothetical protein [Arcobacter sp. FWKO B]|uniref:hypothetical protein n=1 Tax=Arcobacter sp. FWKO B TaxID=2593672 RepID=UPI0018A5D87B|nr:hypothetical protein [Arcobacter sp. FWKO B]QOG11257.1 hypothetical protein FWKOB_00485 [Arcobacter sp. FWKO B]
MKLLFTSLLASSVLLFSGCDSTPKCSDAETVQLLEEILDRGFVKFTIDPSTIRTLDKNSKTGMYTCKVQAKMELSEAFGANNKYLENLQTQNLTYTVVLTDDKKSFYVEIIDK